jgi:preprotein translocase subunit SecD
VRSAVGAAVAALLVAACASAPGGNAPPTPIYTSTGALLVFTTWVPDQGANNGPEPGYRPALSGLTGSDVQHAAAVLDASGSSWLINITFTTSGRTLFDELTRANVAACVGDPNTGAAANCAQRHLALWLDLGQADISSWDDTTYVAKVTMPFDLACLARHAANVVCPKFISDPITLEEISGGEMAIGIGGSRQDAANLASAINATANS